MENISKDLLQLLSLYLEPIEIAKLSQAHIWLGFGNFLKQLFYKRLLSKIDNLFRRHFDSTKRIFKKLLPYDNRIKTHPTDGSYEDFVRAMISSDGLISGSFLLQMITGENFKDSDIDIYMTSTKPVIWKEEFQNTKIDELSDIEVVLWSSHDSDCVESNRYNNSKICRIREYDIREVPMENFQAFQTIHVSEVSSPQDFITKCFDFSFLKNWFWYDKNGNPRIEISDFKSILTRSCTFDRKTYFDNNWFPQQAIESYDEDDSHKNRIKKYESRGYQIHII
jgi:hypothetical protein